MESKHIVSKTVKLPLLVVEYLSDSKKQNKTVSEVLNREEHHHTFLTRWFSKEENKKVFETAWNTNNYDIAAESRVQIKIKNYDLTLFTKDVPETVALEVMEYLKQF